MKILLLWKHLWLSKQKCKYKALANYLVYVKTKNVLSKEYFYLFLFLFFPSSPNLFFRLTAEILMKWSTSPHTTKALDDFKNHISDWKSHWSMKETICVTKEPPVNAGSRLGFLSLYLFSSLGLARVRLCGR